jgi:hypothetical protein
MKRELTSEQLKEIANIVKNQKSLGLISKAKEFYSGELNLNEEDYIKVNLPDSEKNFKSGNGEGIWACPVTEADKIIYHTGDTGETFDVYVLNDCITYPFSCASIIKVRITGSETRPILDYDWMDNIIKVSSNGEYSLEEMLKGA